MKEVRYNNISKEIEELKKYPDVVGVRMMPNVWKNEQIKVLKQTISKFIVDYDLQNTELFEYLKYQISQL